MHKRSCLPLTRGSYPHPYRVEPRRLVDAFALSGSHGPSQSEHDDECEGDAERPCREGALVVLPRRDAIGPPADDRGHADWDGDERSHDENGYKHS